MKFIFARHGESTANRDAIISNLGDAHSLTGQGIQQSKLLAENLSEMGVRKIYSSPLLRARETSRIVSQHLGVPVVFNNALREFSCGTLEGHGDPESWAVFIDLFQAWLRGEKQDVSMAGGESFLDISKRFAPFVSGLIRRYRGKGEGSILVISHGGVFYTMLPGLIENVDFTFARERVITNTSTIIAEEIDGRIYCLEWCGEPIGKRS